MKGIPTLYRKLMASVGIAMFTATQAMAAQQGGATFGTVNNNSTLLTTDPTGGKNADAIFTNTEKLIANGVDILLALATALGIWYTIHAFKTFRKNANDESGRGDNTGPVIGMLCGGGIACAAFVTFAVRNLITS
jgi:hypothetical protein